MKNNYFACIVYLFILLGFLTIHNINSEFVKYLFIFLAIVFAIRRYYNLSTAILLMYFIATPIWLLFNRILHEFFLHYTVLSDVLTIFVLSIISNVLIFKYIKNIRFIIPLILIFFIYDYLAYETILYWIIILTIPIFTICTFNKSLYVSNNKYLKFSTLFICICFLFTYIPTSKVDKIAVLKSDWCDVSKNTNKKSFNMDYFYSYSDFYSLLASYAKTDIITNKDISNNNLKYDLLILITPTTPFSLIELKNLHNFVIKGGKIVVIADHTNLYGHADNLNPLLNIFGAQINDDTLYDIWNYYKEYQIKIGSNVLSKMYTKTNSSLILPPFANIWAISDKIISEKADYTKENFFGNLSFTEDDSIGNFVVGATIRWGLGEIKIWTDSTLFSNFAISQKNNLHLLDYLIVGKTITASNRNLPFRSINIIADNIILREAPPRHLPKDEQYSVLIANQTRYGLFPLYNIMNTNIPTLYFITYKEFEKQKQLFKTNKLKAVIIDDIPENNIFDVKKYNIEDKTKTNECNNNCYYSVDGININSNFGASRIVFGKNVLSDVALGNWWNTIPISPYKKYMLDTFYNWVINCTDFPMYTYPMKIKHITKGNIFYDDGTKKYFNKIDISKKIKHENNYFLYLGKRKWGVLLDNGTIIGGTETQDNILNERELQKWIIKHYNIEKNI